MSEANSDDDIEDISEIRTIEYESKYLIERAEENKENHTINY